MTDQEWIVHARVLLKLMRDVLVELSNEEQSEPCDISVIQAVDQLLKSRP